MLQISDSLWLCSHTTYGASSLFEQSAARRLVEKVGGYDALLRQVLEHAASEPKQLELL